jgi:hypothetical protein
MRSRTKGAVVTMSQEEKERRWSEAEKEIRRAAARIDPRTARMEWTYARVCDPYGLGYDVPPEADCVGREYFLVDPQKGIWVLEHEVRGLHPEISDEEWPELMQAAHERDESPDPLAMFHAYATPEERREAWVKSRELPF